LVAIPNFEGDIAKAIQKIPEGSGKMDAQPAISQNQEDDLANFGDDDDGIDNLLGGDDEQPQKS